MTCAPFAVVLFLGTTTEDTPGMKSKLLKSLEPGEAREVLRKLLAKHRDLVPEAERIARRIVTRVNVEGIADDIVAGVGFLRVEDLGGGGGFDYVAPGEDAAEKMLGVLEPHLRDMDRLVALGLEEAALEVCKGILLGLYRLEEEEDEGVLAWAPDFPTEAICVTLRRWIRGGPGRRVPKKLKDRQRPPFPEDFLDEHVPDWAWRIEEILGPEGGKVRQGGAS